MKQLGVPGKQQHGAKYTNASVKTSEMTGKHQHYEGRRSSASKRPSPMKAGKRVGFTATGESGATAESAALSRKPSGPSPPVCTDTDNPLLEEHPTLASVLRWLRAQQDAKIAAEQENSAAEAGRTSPGAAGSQEKDAYPERTLAVPGRQGQRPGSARGSSQQSRDSPTYNSHRGSFRLRQDSRHSQRDTSPREKRQQEPGIDPGPAKAPTSFRSKQELSAAEDTEYLVRKLGLEGKVRLKAPEPANTENEDIDFTQAAQVAAAVPTRARALEPTPAAGLLANRVGGALKRTVLADEAAARRAADEREERWGVKHPSRAKLRDLNLQAVGLFLHDARGRAFYNQFLPEAKQEAWAERYREQVLSLWRRSRAGESVSPDLLREVQAIQKEEVRRQAEKDGKQRRRTIAMGLEPFSAAELGPTRGRTFFLDRGKSDSLEIDMFQSVDKLYKSQSTTVQNMKPLMRKSITGFSNVSQQSESKQPNIKSPLIGYGQSNGMHKYKILEESNDSFSQEVSRGIGAGFTPNKNSSRRLNEIQEVEKPRDRFSSVKKHSKRNNLKMTNLIIPQSQSSNKFKEESQSPVSREEEKPIKKVVPKISVNINNSRSRIKSRESEVKQRSGVQVYVPSKVPPLIGSFRSYTSTQKSNRDLQTNDKIGSEFKELKNIKTEKEFRRSCINFSLNLVDDDNSEYDHSPRLPDSANPALTNFESSNRKAKKLNYKDVQSKAQKLLMKMTNSAQVYQSDNPTNVFTQASVDKIMKNAMAFNKQYTEYYKVNRQQNRERSVEDGIYSAQNSKNIKQEIRQSKTYQKNKEKQVKPRRQLFKEMEKQGGVRNFQVDRGSIDILRENIPAIDIYSHSSSINIEALSQSNTKEVTGKEKFTRKIVVSKVRNTLSSVQENQSDMRGLTIETDHDHNDYAHNNHQEYESQPQTQAQVSSRKNIRAKKQRNLIIKKKSHKRQRMMSQGRQSDTAFTANRSQSPLTISPGRSEYYTNTVKRESKLRSTLEFVRSQSELDDMDKPVELDSTEQAYKIDSKYLTHHQKWLFHDQMKQEKKVRRHSQVSPIMRSIVIEGRLFSKEKNGELRFAQTGFDKKFSIYNRKKASTSGK